MRDLGAGVQDELFLPGVPVRHRAAGLQRQRVLPSGPRLHMDHTRGPVEDLVDVLGREQRDVDKGVVRGLVVHQRRAGGEGLLLAGDRREDVVRHLGGLQAVLRAVGVTGDDHGEGLADVTHPVAGEHRHGGGDELGRRAVEPGRDVAELQFPGGERGDDARYPAHLGEIDAGDHTVGDGAADELRVEHARQLQVVDETAASGQQPGILPARRRPADHPVVVGGLHRDIASSQARSTRVRTRCLR